MSIRSSTSTSMPPALASRRMASGPMPSESSLMLEFVAPVTRSVRSSSLSLDATVSVVGSTASIETPPADASMPMADSPSSLELIDRAPRALMVALPSASTATPPALVASLMASLPVPLELTTTLESVAPVSDSVRSSPSVSDATSKRLAALADSTMACPAARSILLSAVTAIAAPDVTSMSSSATAVTLPLTATTSTSPSSDVMDTLPYTSACAPPADASICTASLPVPLERTTTLESVAPLTSSVKSSPSCDACTSTCVASAVLTAIPPAGALMMTAASLVPSDSSTRLVS
mmetsp:Transcript_16058/g.49918  ORF Transcript_16058/g.49918 Transcript_16058/m.49918 type:complete len:293 (-) Transcript_16058:183-1061(-)